MDILRDLRPLFALHIFAPSSDLFQLAGMVFTDLPEDQKTWIGNLRKDLNAETLTAWLVQNKFEVPVPLKVVQQ